ncbi:MAG: hypothetical protein WD960_11420 [Gemmatimonadota bacterium]
MIHDDLKLPVSLLSLRIGVFIVMILWSVDKLLNPDHAAAVFNTYYFLANMGAAALFVIGLVQIAIELAFVAGLFRTFTYGFVLVTHLISTLASWPGYLQPFDNLLFFAAWPMLAACFALFLLRDRDTLLSLDEARPSAPAEAEEPARA